MPAVHGVRAMGYIKSGTIPKFAAVEIRITVQGKAVAEKSSPRPGV